MTAKPWTDRARKQGQARTAARNSTRSPTSCSPSQGGPRPTPSNTVPPKPDYIASLPRSAVAWWSHDSQTALREASAFSCPREDEVATGSWPASLRVISRVGETTPTRQVVSRLCTVLPGPSVQEHPSALERQRGRHGDEADIQQVASRAGGRPTRVRRRRSGVWSQRDVVGQHPSSSRPRRRGDRPGGLRLRTTVDQVLRRTGGRRRCHDDAARVAGTLQGPGVVGGRCVLRRGQDLVARHDGRCPDRARDTTGGDERPGTRAHAVGQPGG